MRMLMTQGTAQMETAVHGGSDVMLFAFDADTKLNREALRAREDEAAMEAFIRRNRRFILGCAYKTMKRFVSESDDEWSVALIAFHEAVRSYDEGKGAFKSFAGLVIRRRLLDYVDSQARARREIAADITGAEPEEDEPAAPIQLEAQRRVAMESMARAREETATRDEIEAMQQTLGTYGFSFFDLAECSPKARKTKEACARVIRALLADAALMGHMRRTGNLPVTALCGAADVSRKILENHRRYIIAAAEILDGDYPHLAEYLRFVKKGLDAE